MAKPTGNVMSGYEWEATLREEEAKSKLARREKPSARLNRTGQKRHDPDQAEVELYRAMSLKVRRDLVLMPLLMVLAIDNLVRKERMPDGRPYEMDEEITSALLNSMRKVLTTWPRWERETTSRALMGDAQSLLSNCGAENARVALLGAATLVAKSVDDGAHAAPDSAAVLTALALIQDAEADDRGIWGWRNGSEITVVAERMREHARVKGHL
jgi:hypothetical protein